MKQYVDQLLDDLSAITSKQHAANEFAGIINNDEESFDDALELSKLVCYEQLSFGELIGIQKDLLPPEELLDNVQIKKVLSNLAYSLFAHNCYLDFPDEVNERDQYRILRNEWDTKHQLFKSNINTIDFCDYDQDNCPFGPKNCQCKKYESRC